jgi:hypothetical protein
MWLRRFAWTSLYSLKAKRRKNGGRGRGESGSFKDGGRHCAQFASMAFRASDGGFKYNYEMY